MSIFLEIVVAPGVRRSGARGPRHETEPAACWSTRRWPTTAQRSASTSARTRSARSGPPAARCSSRAPDTLADDPATWQVRHATGPDRRGAARSRPRLAARPWRHLERHRPRPRAAAHRDRLAARRQPGRRRAPGRREGPRDARPRHAPAGAACASDAFYPVPGRGRGLPRGRRDARSSSPAARCATPRSSRSRTGPARRCSSPGCATSATEGASRSRRPG